MSLSRRSATSSGGPVEDKPESEAIRTQPDSIKIFTDFDLARQGGYIADQDRLGHPVSVVIDSNTESIKDGGLESLRKAMAKANMNAGILVEATTSAAAAGNYSRTYSHFARTLTVVAAKPQIPG